MGSPLTLAKVMAEGVFTALAPQNTNTIMMIPKMALTAQDWELRLIISSMFAPENNCYG
jgi:hypothetical protein